MKKSELPPVTIYTDGACSPNPGPGGWAAILLHQKKRPRELSGAEDGTTNNRMELRAAIEALAVLPASHQVRLFTDSKYLKKGICEWLPGWERRGWQTQGKTEVKNQDLWQRLNREVQRHHLTWEWVKGHAGNKWNDRVDSLARQAIVSKGLPLPDNDSIHIFTAVSYSNKSRKGAWSVILRYRDKTKVLCGNTPDTTGNRMHLQAAIEGLAAIKRPLPIHLYTFSGYLKDGASGWLDQWATRNWRTREGRLVSHLDLWKKIEGLTRKHRIRWHVASKANPPCELQGAKLLASEIVRHEA